MTVISKDLDIETLMKKASAFFVRCFKLVKENRIAVKLVSLVLIFFLTVVVDTVSVGLIFGFNVKYEGKVIATVQNKSVTTQARDIAVSNLSSKDASGAISVPKLTLTLTLSNKFDNATTVADAMIENTEDIIEAKALNVNGETVAITNAENLDKLLETRKTAFYKEGAENSAEFTQNVEVVNGLYLKEELNSEDEIKDVIENLEVKTTSKFITDTTVKYKTKTVWSSKQPVGYSKVTTVGKNGISRQTRLIESVNGEEVVNAVLETETISSPVTEVVTVGTAATSSANSAASSAGFVFPLPTGQYKVSSYWGDGRGHKGVDLCANKGVSIYAVASGTVEYSGYKSDYGYHIVINHGNGIKTRYAHASALCVKKGDTVSQGQTIAAVGNTGYSMGNHLHFEVIVNGTRVNPAPYINLR